MNNFQLVGLKEIANKFDFYDKSTQKRLRGAIKRAAKPVLADAKARAPVAADIINGLPPGTLKRDITIIAERSRDNKEKYVVRVGLKRRSKSKALNANGEPYGVFVEYGTSKSPAQPYLKPALEENRDAIVDGVIDELFAEFLGR